MKKQKFVKLSDVILPLDELKLENDELIALKGGYGGASSGTNCRCVCSPDVGEMGSSGDNCDCNCNN
ncbi:MAG: hypothetical protein HQ521_10180 [Bacteroidetes bacterium]|nr:hypothetical protein [Bacteroidota bacterium]